ncbi:MAG TPA: molybdopterin-dependent oxidoreductase [Bacteroidia bacterium]|nr:molybdopterin-dependent oxidoreductase [Bacteroidia bacterium]HRH07742.1 molybdopterin-dependent oxidoreductase [Bacteroidia bacterium]
MKNIDSFSHTRGESIYADDIALQQGTLYAVAYDSKIAHGKIRHLSIDAAKSYPGVEAVLTYLDIPGENQIGGIIPDEELLAEHEVHFCGMPIALVVAKSQEIAEAAAKLIQVDIEILEPITDAREAAKNNKLIVPPRTFQIGDTASQWSHCTHIIEGIAESGGQEHLYIETQGAYALPLENGSIKIYSSTQGPTAVQRTAAKVLGVPMHKIEVDVTRLGGGFGGKEDQATTWAVMAALACKKLKRPVKCILDRMADLRMTGKRHPYSSDFKLGLSSDLKIIAYEATFYQNAGAAADLSPAVLERTLFHATNSYSIPHTKVTAFSCKTNLPPNTAFRGFGGPQGMFVIEAAIAKAAENLGIDASVIQQKNLLQDGNVFHYGQIVNGCEAHNCWDTATNLFQFEKERTAVKEFNKSNLLIKKGMAIMPICFGISFTKTLMNQARALVHVYTDGSVGISTGAVEMGQGVNTKMLQVAANIFSISSSKIKVETTNTTRVANTSPSAASATADLNGKATQLACEAIKKRLLKRAAIELSALEKDLELKDECVLHKNVPTEITWNKLVMSCYLNRESLSESAHYATPEINFDSGKEKGHPFAYHVYGTALFIVTVDCLRGTYETDAVKIVHDYGESMNPFIDKGQIEGGLVQGIGWMTMEEVVYNKEGKLLSNALSTYKVPDIYSVPKEITIHPLKTKGSDLAIFKSKAVGEPPLMYGIGAYFALRNAVLAFNPSHTMELSAPLTPEKILMNLYA